MRATLRPSPVPTLAIIISTSGYVRSSSSTWRVLASVYSRLEPTGVVSRKEVRPSSASGTNSVPTSGSRKKLPMKIATASASTFLRLPSAHSSSRP